MPSYLVTGAGGQLGQCFQAVASEYPEHQLFFVNRAEVNILETQTLSNYYEQFPFEGIINCAAYTQVDQAQIEAQQAFKINAEGVQNLIEFSENKNLKLIHFSSDFVFDGTKESSYLETDTSNPLSVYGESKLGGELVLAKSDCQSLCVRVSWLFSPFGKNFVKTILNASQSRNELEIVDDQFGKPSYGIDLARALLTNLDNANLFTYSTYHFAQGPKTNWYEFAIKIVSQAGSRCKVKPIPSSAYPSAAIRPLNAVLDTQQIEKTLSLSLRNWESALTDCINRIQKSEII